MSTEQEQAKPTASRKTKNFSPKERKEALRLIFEENFTLQQAADKIGCSLNSIKAWKMKYPRPKPSGPKTTTKRQPPKETRTADVKKSRIAFDDFVRNYWNEGTRAVDVLLLPPEIGPDVVRYVNEALRYAYDHFRK